MRVPKVKPVVAIPKLKPITKRTKLTYKSDIDPAVIIHSNKTHRTVSEAFRDADYATPIWRCENDWDRAMEYLKWIGVWAFTFFMLYQLAIGFERWIAS